MHERNTNLISVVKVKLLLIKKVKSSHVTPYIYILDTYVRKLLSIFQTKFLYIGTLLGNIFN